MAGIDWALTPVGEMALWPQSLRTAVGICLESRFPLLIWWGRELVMIYNDGYRPILGAKHPLAMGRPGAQSWPEIWGVIGPMLDGVMETGRATWSEDQLLLLDRNGYEEECYFTFSYSPIREESGAVGGVFTAVFETTARVVGERRLLCLRMLADARADCESAREVIERAAGVLEDLSADIVFACIYPVSAERELGEGTCIGLAEDVSGAVWHLEEEGSLGVPIAIADLDAAEMRLRDPHGSMPSTAVALPVRGAGEAPRAYLVCGINPRRELDEDYRSFLGLVADDLATGISSAEAREEERRRAAALAELDEAKTKFFSNVSHEFRTPLTLLLGPLEDLLAEPAQLSDAQRETLVLARRNALRMRRLVNSLLDMSQVERGRLEPTFQRVELPSYTAELAEAFRAAIEGAGLSLSVSCPPLEGPAFLDVEMWDKIVLNLLSNALKHTWEGGITVALREIDATVELEITDSGTGILAEELPRLFERFHQVRGARARSVEGSGIGLALVDELVRLHAGQVQVRSELGVGSTFTVRIPLLEREVEADGAHQPDAAPAAEAYLSEAQRWDTLQEANGLPTVEESDELEAYEGASDVEPLDVHLGRVLVVDDNADMREYLARLLGDRFETDTAADGHGALAAIQARRPDLVLTDVMMPGMDGLELLEAIRANPQTARLPVIMLSARAGQENSVGGLEAGADDYLVKPFSRIELLARVRSNLQAARAREEVTEQAVSRARRLDRLVRASLRIDARLETLGVLEQLAQEAQALFEAVSATAEDGEGNHRTAGAQQHAGEEHVEPLLATAGSATGALRVGLAPGVSFDPEDHAICAQLALVGAGALQRARMHAAERDTVQRLQESLLPQHLPVVPGLQLAVRYLPASAGAAVGGDWYDVVTLPRGWLGVVVGDVVGHGLEAAATMSYLRNVLRAYLLEGNTPGSALMRMHTLVDRAEAGLTATLSCLTIDPVTGVGWIASAGHPAPLRISAAGDSEYLDTGAGRQPALGVGAPPHPAEQQIALAPGETLLLYSDGLIEPRDGSDGMERLHRVASGPSEDLDVYCDGLIDRLAPRSARRDDVALLALRRSSQQESVLELRPRATPAAGAEVRAQLRPWLRSRSLDPRAIEDALLAVSEAVGNAIEHSGISSSQDVSVRARVSDGELRVTVRDSGRWRAPHHEPLRGYGLTLMQALSERVRIDRRDDGTRVELTAARTTRRTG